MTTHDTAFKVDLGVLGVRVVKPDASKQGHWLWQNVFGQWSDCNVQEDAICNQTCITIPSLS